MTTAKKPDLSVAAERDKITGGKRSDKWPAVEHAHLKQFPTCASCGSTTKLNVHHKYPFHLHPELELDPTNLITLCMDPATECHIKVGHGDNFKAYNPDVEPDAEYVSEHKDNLQKVLTEVAANAKKKRLFG